MPSLSLIATYLAFIVVLYFYAAPLNFKAFPIEKRNKKLPKKSKKTHNQIYKNQYQSIAEQLIFISFIEGCTTHHPQLKNIKDNYIRRISITNSISEDEATVKANQWLFNSLLLAVASFVFAFILLRVAVISILVTVALVYFYMHHINSKIKKNIQ